MTLRLSMLNLMQTMTHGILGDQEMAAHLEDVAIQMEASGRASEAALLRSLSRRHRVRALEMQGRLAALSEEYREQFYDQVGGGPQAP